MAIMTTEWNGTEYFPVNDFHHVEFLSEMRNRRSIIIAQLLDLKHMPTAVRKLGFGIPYLMY